MALPRVVAVSLAQKFDTTPIAAPSRIRTQIAPAGVWYAHWYSIFCTVENRRTPKWLRILFNAGQGTILPSVLIIRQRSFSSITTGTTCIFPALSFARFCWYPANLLVDRGGVGIAIFGGIEPMPAKNDTYFRHLKAGEKDDKRSGPTPLHARH
jgi:hypothetical protein